MRKAKEIECVTTMRLVYDPDSEDFKRTLADFKDAIFKHATERHIIEQVAFYVVKHGASHMIEGIGYISIAGQRQGEPYSGIDLADDDFEFEFDSKDALPY